MIRALKYFGLSLLAIVVLLGAAAAALMFWIDPNIFKDDIEKLARDQGFELALEGDLAWQFYPDIQIALGQSSVAKHSSPDQKILSFENAGLSVALLPLLKGALQVQGITLEGADIQLLVDENGQANWALNEKADETPTAPGDGSANNTAALQAGIAHFRVSNSRVHFVDKQAGREISIQDLNLSGDGISLGKAPFPIDLSAKLDYRDATQTLAADIGIEGIFGVSTSLDHFTINGLEAIFKVGHKTETMTVDAASTLTLNAEIKSADMNAGAAETKKALTWSLSNISLKDTTVNYSDVNKQEISISALEVQGAVIPGDALNSIDLKATLGYSSPGFSLPPESQVDLNGQFGINSSLDRIILKSTALNATIQGQRIVLNTDTTVALAPELTYDGSIDISTFNLRKIAAVLGMSLPEMASAEALSKLSLKAAVKGDSRKIQIPNAILGLDSSTVTASATLPSDPGGNKKLSVAIDRINVDNYLPPVSEAPANDKAAPAGTSDALPIPRELLNSLNLDADIKIEAMTARTIPLKDLQLKASVHNGITRISPLKGHIYDSPFNLDAQLTTRSAPSVLVVKGDSTALPVGRLLRELKVTEVFSGISNIKLDIRTQGDSQTLVMQNLNGSIDLSAQEMRLNNMNIERAFCQLVTRLQEEPFDATTWPAYSDLKDTVTRINFTDGVAKIETLTAGVTKIALGGKGKIDLRQESFDVVLNSRLSQADQDTVSCKIKNEKLLDRDIPIRCKAEFGKISATSCLPDFRLIEDIAKDKAKTKLEEKAQEAIDKKFSGEKGDAAKQLFKQFLNK